MYPKRLSVVLPAVLLLLPVLSVSPIFRYFWLHQNYRIRKHHLHLFFELAALLGPSEDFDGLVSMLEDYGF